MTQTLEIFENEEATKFLDYFVNYLKLMNKVDTIKNLATRHNENLHETQPTETNSINELNISDTTIICPITLDP
ncbi:MAG: hypothetical protein ACFCUE_02125 [Candidatus Bathyarchaeia archaeon]|jgi:hypothetical protein